MTLISDLHKQWSNDPKYQAAYETQRPGFKIASAIITARSQELWRLLVTLLKN